MASGFNLTSLFDKIVAISLKRNLSGKLTVAKFVNIWTVLSSTNSSLPLSKPLLIIFRQCTK